MLRIEQLLVRFDEFVLGPLDLTVEGGAYMMVLGISGAGKSVMLETIAGLKQPASGRILLNEVDITKLSAGKRGIGLVYQDQALFPHLNVEENIWYSLRMGGTSLTERKARTKELADMVGVGHLLKRNVLTLSGGEGQRVALARTLASNVDVLLFDEPLSSLDPQMKNELRLLLGEIHRRGKTIIHVTHDYVEAASLGTHVAIIEKGQLVQQGFPEDVFNKPENEFVAHFCGVKNFFKAKLDGFSGDNDLRVAIIGKGLKIALLSQEMKSEGYIIIPGEDVILSEQKNESSALNTYYGQVTGYSKAVMGMEVFVDIGVNVSVNISHQSFEKLRIEQKGPIWVSIKASSVQFIKSCI